MTPSFTKNLLLKRQQKNADKLFGFGGTTNAQSKPKIRKAKDVFGDGLAVSGFSVAPKQTRPGNKRF